MNSKDIKIMFLNDNEHLVETLAEFSRKKGFSNTVSATNSTEALKLSEKEKPQICVFDIVLVGSRFDGIATFEEIRKDNPKTVCIFFSSYTDELERAKAAGMFDFIKKPFNPNELFAIVDRAVEKLNERKP